MTDLNALLRAVITDPDDDTVRLVYADALDELPTKSVTCPSCNGTLWVDADYDMRTNCKRCDGTGTVTDTSNRDRAYIIRAHVNEPDRLYVPSLIGYPDGIRYGFERGFVASISCTAEQLLAHADELIWHPSQKIKAPKCEVCGGVEEDERGRWKDKHGHDYWIRCGHCKGKSTLPRPCPDTAQPISRVVLTTPMGWGVGTFSKDRKWRIEHPQGREWVDVLRAEWPGVEFELPTVGYPDPDVAYTPDWDAVQAAGP